MRGAYGLAIFTIVMMFNLILFLGIVSNLVRGATDISGYYGKEVEQVTNRLCEQTNSSCDKENIFDKLEDSKEDIEFALDNLEERGYNLRKIPIIGLFSP